ncbi:hypothetical protein XENTR_v10017905 [Xenopus tropicalis]|nr:hypothetical protein XENTR_v10017905 [Xenopus tropicalis]
MHRGGGTLAAREAPTGSGLGGWVPNRVFSRCPVGPVRPCLCKTKECIKTEQTFLKSDPNIVFRIYCCYNHYKVQSKNSETPIPLQVNPSGVLSLGKGQLGGSHLVIITIVTTRNKDLVGRGPNRPCGPHQPIPLLPPGTVSAGSPTPIMEGGGQYMEWWGGVEGGAGTCAGGPARGSLIPQSDTDYSPMEPEQFCSNGDPQSCKAALP